MTAFSVASSKPRGVTVSWPWHPVICRGAPSAALALCFLAGGCGSDDGDASPVDAGAPADAAAADAGQEGSTVTGTQIDRHAVPNDEVEEPVDLSDAAIEALWIDDSESFASAQGEGRADGTFAVEGVPEDEFYLRVDVQPDDDSFAGAFHVTRERELDLGVIRVGYPDSDFPSEGTTIDFQVTDMEPFEQFTDRLALVVPQTGSVARFVESAITPAIQDGATALEGEFDLWDGLGVPARFRGDRGDTPVLLHVQELEDDRRAVTGAATFELEEDFVHDDGTELELSGAFQGLELEDTTIELLADDIDELAAELTPGDDDLISMHVLAGAGPIVDEQLPLRGLVPQLPFLAQAEFEAEDADVTISHANPFSDDWDEIGTLQVSASHFYDVEGESVSLSAVARHTDELGALSGDPVAPPIPALSDLEVEGLDASERVEDVGTTPEISWAAPSSVPSNDEIFYRVDVHTLRETAPDDLSFRLSATVYTTETDLRIPPGVIADDDQVAIRVRAMAGAPSDAPHRPATPFSYTERLSALITP